MSLKVRNRFFLSVDFRVLVRDMKITFQGHYWSVAKVEYRIWCTTWNSNFKRYLVRNLQTGDYVKKREKGFIHFQLWSNLWMNVLTNSSDVFTNLFHDFFPQNFLSLSSWKWYFVTKIVLTRLWEKIVLVIEKNFWNSSLSFEITITIYSNSERSEQFLVT